jgi:hypothetical protein
MKYSNGDTRVTPDCVDDDDARDQAQRGIEIDPRYQGQPIRVVWIEVMGGMRVALLWVELPNGGLLKRSGSGPRQGRQSMLQQRCQERVSRPSP